MDNLPIFPLSPQNTNPPTIRTPIARITPIPRILDAIILLLPRSRRHLRRTRQVAEPAAKGGTFEFGADPGAVGDEAAAGVERIDDAGLGSGARGAAEPAAEDRGWVRGRG